MASFPPNLLPSLPSLSTTGQQLLVINNLRGISESERSAYKALILNSDPRMATSIEAFLIDRDANALVNYWRSLDLEAQEEEEEETRGCKRLSKEAVVGLLDGVYRKLNPNEAVQSRTLASRAGEEFFADYGSRDGKASLEDLQAWLSADSRKPAAKKPAPKPRQVEVVPAKAPVQATIISAQPGLVVGANTTRPAPAIKVESRPEPEPIVEEPTTPKKPTRKSAPNPMKRLVELRDDAGLSNVSPVQIVDRVKALFGKKDDITEAEFVEIMMELGKKYSGARRESKESALREIFVLMDINKSQTLDREELINALAAISGGSEEDKIEAVFMLYDINGDGLISFDEMNRHQTAVFRMAFALNPKLRTELGTEPESLATATTEALFLELDTDKNNVISLDEFKAWYSGETPSEEAKSARLQRTRDLASQRVPPPPPLNPTASLDSLKETIAGLGLTGVHVADAMAVFKEHGAGIFSRQQFKDTLKSVIQQYGNPDQLQEADFNAVSTDLFLTFDIDQSSTVDMQEVFSGLSILCEGTPGEKLRVAFDLYDESGDGFIQYQELVKYIGAVFRLVLARQGQQGANVEELSKATARDCFRANEQNEDTGKLTFVQFKEWHDAIGVRI